MHVLGQDGSDVLNMLSTLAAPEVLAVPCDATHAWHQPRSNSRAVLRQYVDDALGGLPVRPGQQEVGGDHAGRRQVHGHVCAPRLRHERVLRHI